MNVFVITNVEAGWDCVRGVYTTIEKAQDYLRMHGFSEEDIQNNETGSYIVHPETLN